MSCHQKSTFKSNFSGYANSYDHIYIPETATHANEFAGQSQTLDATKLVYGNTSVANITAVRLKVE